MRGGLRWPNGPFQVTCVLVAVLLTAPFSLYPGVGGHSGAWPLISGLLKRLAERSGSGVIAIAPNNPNNGYQLVACDFSSGFDERDIPSVRAVNGNGTPQDRASRNAIEFCTTEPMPSGAGEATGES